MATTYPTSIDSFVTKTDGPSQKISASHINNLQDSIVAIETKLKTTAQDVKVYRALVSQTAGNAPVATVLENSLGGVVVWSRTDPGMYEATLAGAFPTNKTFYNPMILLDSGDIGNGYFIVLTIGSGNNMNFVTGTYAPATWTMADNIFNNTPVEFLVYP